MSNKFVVVDLETTGNLPKKGEKIIQFAAVVVENGKITDQFSSLINPQKSIPIFIEELTGINNEMVKSAPVFSEIAPQIVDLLENAYFVAHNVLFDLSFLQEELIQSGCRGFYGPVIDTVELARILFPTADGYKLTDLAERENLQHERPHQADSDAFVTAELFLILSKKLTTLPLALLKQLKVLSEGLKSDIYQLLDDLIFEKDKIAEEIPDSIEIFNGIALKKYLPTTNRVIFNGKYPYPKSEQEKIKAMQQAIDSFEKRNGQFKMMDFVYESFINKSKTLIEAGTGIGKTIGYLLPVAFFAKQYHLPIVISTHTIQLQEQLINKEIPLLTKMLPFDLNSIIVKGRNHYISLEKFSQTLMDENDNYDIILTKMQILIWLIETETGDKDELNLSSGGLIYWNKIKNDEKIFSKIDKWKDRDFYYRTKKKAEEADFIITNHSLLLSDLSINGGILPNYEYVIIDEGHHLEKVASRFLGNTLDYLSIRLLLSKLGTYEQMHILFKLEKVLETVQVSKTYLPSTNELSDLVTSLVYEMDEFFKMVAFFAKKEAENNRGFNRIKLKLPLEENNREVRALIHSAERFAFLLKDLTLCLNERLDLIKKCDIHFTKEQILFLDELNIFLADIENLRDKIWEVMLKENKANVARWIEVDFRSIQNVTMIFEQPTTVANSLKTKFFQKKKGVILTSATLTIDQSFEFIMNQIGLESGSTKVLSIPSPFEYKNQVQILIPEDLPEVNMVSVEEYVIAITEHLISIAEATNGRMLILFTSHDMLKRTYDLIKESGFLEDFMIIAQGITSGSRTRLTRNFQKYEKAILLGTSSFWEGIDIPGDDLSCLVIVRLPFSPPDEPFTEAKCEYIRMNGGNAFLDFSLPEAILRFKQGFGRLIRTEKDRGVMVVFDKRIITTRYGQAFLKSIPAVEAKKGSINEIVDHIHSWL